MSELSPKPFQTTKKIDNAIRVLMVAGGLGWFGLWTHEAHSSSTKALEEGSALLVAKALAEATLGAGVCTFAFGVAGVGTKKGKNY